ncbi:MAG: PhzF family phenazine biosynthesis protein, partial [Proteobacteria bacterium]|nr:PhzF family phenazine biosynthesis protein [Pseudomonadota bacterium]
AEDLTDVEMQMVARETGVPATGFVVPTDSADFAVRFFTPVQEIGMCGHGLVALCKRLVDEGKVKPGTGAPVDVTLKTNSGIVPVQVHLDGDYPLVMMKQKTPVFRPCDVNPQDLARALGMAPDRIAPDLPLEVASAALEHLIVPVRDLKTLEGLQPDFTRLANMSREIGVISIDVFTMETIYPDSTVHSRDFCPAAGIPEAAGSGTTNSALFCYLIRNGILSAADGSVVRIRAEQGHEMNRPSQIQCEASMRSGQVHDLKVGGTAVMSIDGRVSLPAARIGV